MAAAEASPQLEGSPPPEALPQADGSFVQEHPDGSTSRWTKRPDGTWRKPQRVRAGWVGDLERQKYPPSPKATALGSPTMAAQTAAEGTPPPMAGGEESTAAPEAEDGPAKKHNLQHRWCLWIHQRPGQQYSKDYGDTNWSEQQRVVHEFGTAEDFWCMMHFSHPPSKLGSSDYSLFRHNVTPAWEDPTFKRGGRWVVKLEKLKTDTLDELWKLLTMALVGEAFSDYGGDAVCGAIVSVRNRGSKASLWLCESSRVERILAIGHRYRSVLAEATGLEGLQASSLTFEYFGRQHGTLDLPELYRGKSTIGVFQ